MRVDTLAKILFGIILGGSLMYFTREDPTVTMFREDYDKKVTTDSQASVGHGLYSAIVSCNKQGGVTTIEGNPKSMIACYAHDTTYYQVDWKWVPYNF